MPAAAFSPQVQRHHNELTVNARRIILPSGTFSRSFPRPHAGGSLRNPHGQQSRRRRPTPVRLLPAQIFSLPFPRLFIRVASSFRVVSSEPCRRTLSRSLCVASATPRRPGLTELRAGRSARDRSEALEWDGLHEREILNVSSSASCSLLTTTRSSFSLGSVSARH